MSIYIHIDQRSDNNMLLILCGTLCENTKNPAYNAPGLSMLSPRCGVFDH
jgi:hypothetical protein